MKRKSAESLGVNLPKRKIHDWYIAPWGRCSCGQWARLSDGICADCVDANYQDQLEEAYQDKIMSLLAELRGLRDSRTKNEIVLAEVIHWWNDAEPDDVPECVVDARKLLNY